MLVLPSSVRRLTFYMVDYGHLNNAPIIEAVFDLKIDRKEPITDQMLGSLKEELEPDFSNIEEIKTVGVFHKHNEPSPPQADLEILLGYKLKDPEKKTVLQIRKDGFTYSKLKPYSRWDDVFTETKQYWEKYNTACTPDFVTRSAIRYINRFIIPGDSNLLKDYLKSPPVIPTGVSQDINKFITQVTSTHDKGIMSNFIQVFEPSADPKKSIVVLDIDIFRKKNISPNSATLWQVFADFRSIRNILFFENLTSEAISRCR